MNSTMDPPTATDSTQKDLTVGELWCREYCSGNLATWYCPQCSAIFCASCYDREHRGNERKANHRRITSVRPVCNEHKHTLDFFDWTSLSPLCLICKENLTESSDHLVDKIELVLPKLRRLVQEKLDKSRLLYERISSSFTAADTEADKTVARAFDQLRYCFQEARNILERREAAVQKKIKKLCESFKNSPGRVSVQTQLKILTGLINEGEALLNKDPGQFAEDFTPFYSHFNALYMSLNECKPPMAFRLNITLGRNTLEQINRLGEVMLRTDKKVKSHLSKSEVMDGQVMVEQDPILSVSPLLSSTAGSVTPVRSPVSFETKEPCWPETRKVAMVATTGTIEKRQNGVPGNADQLLSGTKQMAMEPVDERQVIENDSQLLTGSRQIILVAATEPIDKRQVPSGNADQRLSGTRQMPYGAYPTSSALTKMAFSVCSLPGAAKLCPVSPGKLAGACENHHSSSPLTTRVTHIQQGARPPASDADTQTPQAPSPVPIGTGQSGQETGLLEPHPKGHIPGEACPLPGGTQNTQMDTGSVWHSQTSQDASQRQTPQETSLEPCDHRETPQDVSPEYPPLHRPPAARKCIEAQFTKLKFDAETGAKPQVNFETKAITKKQKSAKKSKQAAPGRTRTPENSKDSLRKRTTPKNKHDTDDSQTSSSCKRRRRGDELSKEFSKCDEILTEMWASEDSFPFVHPVDKRKFPDYYTKVIKPMDMTYIKETLHSLRYESVVEFVRDVQLIFQNCRSYNQPSSFATEAALRLEDLFRELMKARFPNFHEIFPSSCSTP